MLFERLTEDHVGKANRVAVAQIENAVAIDPDRIGAIAVPIADHRIVAGDAIVERHIRKACVIGILQEDNPIKKAGCYGKTYLLTAPSL